MTDKPFEEQQQRRRELEERVSGTRRPDAPPPAPPEVPVHPIFERTEKKLDEILATLKHIVTLLEKK